MAFLSPPDLFSGELPEKPCIGFPAFVLWRHWNWPSVRHRPHTPSIAFRHLPPKEDVVNQCLEFASTLVQFNDLIVSQRRCCNVTGQVSSVAIERYKINKSLSAKKWGDNFRTLMKLVVNYKRGDWNNKDLYNINYRSVETSLKLLPPWRGEWPRPRGAPHWFETRSDWVRLSWRVRLLPKDLAGHAQTIK